MSDPIKSLHGARSSLVKLPKSLRRKSTLQPLSSQCNRKSGSTASSISRAIILLLNCFASITEGAPQPQPISITLVSGAGGSSARKSMSTRLESQILFPWAVLRCWCLFIWRIRRSEGRRSFTPCTTYSFFMFKNSPIQRSEYALWIVCASNDKCFALTFP